MSAIANLATAASPAGIYIQPGDLIGVRYVKDRDGKWVSVLMQLDEDGRPVERLYALSIEFDANYLRLLTMNARKEAALVKLAEAGGHFEHAPLMAYHRLACRRVPWAARRNEWLESEGESFFSNYFRESLREANRLVSQSGFEAPGDNVERWAHLARIIEKDPRHLTLGEVVDEALAWVDREKFKLKLKLPLGSDPCDDDRRPSMRHSPDFSQVFWGDREFLFTGTAQRKAVECLWAVFEAGTDVVSEGYVQEKADVASRLVHLFRNHPAWGTLIKKRKGTTSLYYLAEPS